MEELIHQFMLVTEGVNCPPGETYFGHENPKGELGFYIHSTGGGVPYRMKIRSPSFINLSIISKIFPGCMMSDTVAILGSLDFVTDDTMQNEKFKIKNARAGTPRFLILHFNF